MRRRDFIAGVGAAALPLGAQAQQHDPVRHIGAILTPHQPAAWANAFVQALDKLGWGDGRNVRIDYRSGTGDIAHYSTVATELVGLGPDVLFAGNTSAVAALQRATRSIPIVFALVTDPVGLGFVASLARPGGNITGFAAVELSLLGKWLELLKEAAPQVGRVAILYNPETAPYMQAAMPYARTAAAAYAVGLIEAPVHNETDMEATLGRIGREPGAGLIVPGDAFIGLHKNQINALAVQHHLPAIYGVLDPDLGGLMYYSNDFLVDYRRAAGYIDRILRGEKPADLPVQAPTRFELVVNLKAAKAIGLTISETFLVRADKVIE